MKSTGCQAIQKEPVQSLDCLLQAAAEGDRQAFDELILAIEDDVVRTALYLTRHLQDAQDVAQDVYVRLIRNRQQLPQVDNFRGWLHRITLNAARDLLRRRRFWVPVEKVRDWVKASDRVEQSQLGDRLRLSLQKLTFKQRAAFVFRELHELSYAEVASILDCSPVTVRVHLMTARKRMRLELEEFGR